MKNVKIDFEYDEEALRRAGVSLDEGAVALLRGMMLESLLDRLEMLAADEGSAQLRRELALAEAFTEPLLTEEDRDVLTYRRGAVEVVLHGSRFLCTGCGEYRDGSEVGLRTLRGVVRNQPQCKRCRSRR